MKKKLIIKYVGQKMAKLEPIVAEAKQIWDEKKYVEFVESLDACKDVDLSLKRQIEVILRKRFDLVPHKCVFYKPTIGQWISDLIGRYTTDDILCAFSQASGLPVECFKEGTIGDILNRPFLEDLVELLEVATGRKLLKYGHLYHLSDSFTYAQLAAFFATE